MMMKVKEEMGKQKLNNRKGSNKFMKFSLNDKLIKNTLDDQMDNIKSKIYQRKQKSLVRGELNRLRELKMFLIFFDQQKLKR